jgi:hypothetical protein
MIKIPYRYLDVCHHSQDARLIVVPGVQKCDNAGVICSRNKLGSFAKQLFLGFLKFARLMLDAAMTASKKEERKCQTRTRSKAPRSTDRPRDRETIGKLVSILSAI